jgi:hypothetical protein
MEEGEEYVLHQHTIPLFIPLADLCEEFLGCGVVGLKEFALSVHWHLISLSKWIAIVTHLKAIDGIETVRADDAVRLVELVSLQWVAKIVLLDKGERCVVLNHNDKRMQDIERTTLGNADIDILG